MKTTFMKSAKVESNRDELKGSAKAQLSRLVECDP